MKNTIGQLKELKYDIAASLYIKPCTEDELITRDFLKQRSPYGLGILIRMLEQEGAIYYKDSTICVFKKWAKKNLIGYELF
jgi:hypothetical protein